VIAFDLSENEDRIVSQIAGRIIERLHLNVAARSPS